MGVICYFYAHVHQTNLEFGKNIITKYLFWLLESNNTPSMHNMNIMLWINHCQNITPPYYTLCNNIFIFFLTMNVCNLHKERLKWSWVERGPKLLLNIWLRVEWSSTILRVSSKTTPLKFWIMVFLQQEKQSYHTFYLEAVNFSNLQIGFAKPFFFKYSIIPLL